MSARSLIDPLADMLDTLVPPDRPQSSASWVGTQDTLVPPDLPVRAAGPAAPRTTPFDDLSFEEDDLFSDAEDGRTVVLAPSHASDRLGRGEAPTTQQFPWSAKFCLDLALGFDSEEQILLQHNIDQPTFERFKRMPAFRRDLAVAMTTIREEGLTFKAKCRVFSEEYLDTIYAQLNDSSVGVSQRFEMFKQMVKLGGLEPKPEKAEADAFANIPRIAIQINL